MELLVMRLLSIFRDAPMIQERLEYTICRIDRRGKLG